MNSKIIYFLILAVFINIFYSCKKLVEVKGPATSVSSANIFKNDATAIGAITNLYVNLSSFAGGGTSPRELTSLSCIAGLSADELIYYNSALNTTLAAFYKNALTNINSGGSGGDYWSTTYERIYAANAILEGVSTSVDLSPKVKQQLLGEAKFMRAFYYFYLVNIYGDVPLVLTTDYTKNALISKSSSELIYKQIVGDLVEAKNLLSDQYLKGDCKNPYPLGAEERVRPTKWAAIFLLARTYLFMKDWENAELESTLILKNTNQFKLESIDKVFLKNNIEAVWQLQPTSVGLNTVDANNFVLPQGGPSYLKPVYLNENIIKDFEKNDLRKIHWINSVKTNNITYYYSYKYKAITSTIPDFSITEYSTVFRLAEQFLIRAEARTQLGKFSEAIDDLDKIRYRSGLNLIKEVSPNVKDKDLLDLIFKEKRLEFFTEWGHRWLDLKRTNSIDQVMSIVTPTKANGMPWKSFQRYYPISITELKANPNLTPTPGY